MVEKRHNQPIPTMIEERQQPADHNNGRRTAIINRSQQWSKNDNNQPITTMVEERQESADRRARQRSVVSMQ